MQTYYFDVTDIVLYIKNETTISGIQRVALEVIKRAVGMLGSQRVKIGMWDKGSHSYLAMDADFLLELEEFDPDFLAAALLGRPVRKVQAVPEILARYSNHRTKYFYHWLRANLEEHRQNHRYFERRGSTLERWVLEKAKARKSCPAQPVLSPSTSMQKRVPLEKVANPSDRLIILGATWGLQDFNAHLIDVKETLGVDIDLLVHDLIPLVAIEHLADDFSETFYRWLEESTLYCSRYFANSQNTGRDLRRFLSEVNSDLPINVVPLAQALGDNCVGRTSSDFRSQLNATKGVRRSVLNMTKTPYVLVVGTLETRKNIWRLAQAWQQLIQDPQVEPPRLIFAGKKGWYIDEFLDWMKASGNLEGWISIAEKPTDKELAFLFHNCEFTANVSTYEGWGLPVGEGLSFGKTGVVAANSSLTEVGGDMVEYCNAHSINSIRDACKRLIVDETRRAELEQRIKNTRLRSWDDVTNDMLGYLN